MSKKSISKNIRLIGVLEGISYIVLLGIAMPLKYWAGHPEYVKYTGWAHGLLFMMFLVAIIVGKIVLNWSLLRMVVAFIASLLPFGTFILDKKLKEEEELLS